MATIKIHLLESRVATATYNDVSIESPNNYRIIAGEENATQFEIVYDQNVWNGYTFSVEMVNSKGDSVPTSHITTNTFTLPKGMATAGYGYIGIKAKKGNEIVPFMPVKVKVWNYLDAWKGNVIDKNITVQDFVELENRVEYLEQNGTGGGGSTPANAVTTDTAQTITGEKTFTKPVFLKNESYEDPSGTDGLEITPHSIVHYDTYVPEEDGFRAELAFPSTGGVLATQEYVQDYVAQNGGGSSADVGEIQFCCVASVSTTTQIGKTTSIGKNNISGTPVVGGRVLFQNGFGLITSIDNNYVRCTVEQIMRIMFNGTSRAINETNFYAPTSAGASGYILRSNGSGMPSWTDPALLFGDFNASRVYTYAITDASDDYNRIVFRLFGRLGNDGIYLSVEDKIRNAIVSNVGYNAIVPANGAIAGEAVWGIEVQGDDTIVIYTTSGTHGLEDIYELRLTYNQQYLFKEFSMGE